MDHKEDVEACIESLEGPGPVRTAELECRIADLHAKLLIAERLDEIRRKLDDVCGTISVIQLP